MSGFAAQDVRSSRHNPGLGAGRVKDRPGTLSIDAENVIHSFFKKAMSYNRFWNASHRPPVREKAETAVLR